MRSDLNETSLGWLVKGTSLSLLLLFFTVSEGGRYHYMLVGVFVPIPPSGESIAMFGFQRQRRPSQPPCRHKGHMTGHQGHKLKNMILISLK